jgi:alpha-methylacyl-CoA racemase
MGADVIRVDRAGASFASPGDPPPGDILGRSRRSICLDLKQSAGVEMLLRLVDGADALIESFRPGVAERLGIGPEVCHARNVRLVYGRMTGWGQSGPYASLPGHDINYIALAGALHPIGPPDRPPPPPLNMIGDLGGGGMLLAFGVVCALFEARLSGQGQVVDAAMIDGAAALTAQVRTLRHAGMWVAERGANFLDGGAHFYSTKETPSLAISWTRRGGPGSNSA